MARYEVHGSYERWSMVFVYDPRTGDIVHAHHVVSAPGGAHPDRDTLEQEAAEQALRASNTPLETMAFLHVDPREIDSDSHYAVDVNSRSLVKTALSKSVV